MAIVYRSEKGSDLTPAEVDNNFAELEANTIQAGTGNVIAFDRPRLFGVSSPLTSFTLDLSSARIGVPVAIAINAPTAPNLPSPIQLQTGEFIANTDITLYLQYWSPTKIVAQYSNIVGGSSEPVTGIMADANLVEWWDSFEGVTTEDTAPVTASNWAGKKSSLVLNNTTKADQPEYSTGLMDFSGATKRLRSNNAALDLANSDWSIAGRFTLSASTASQHILGKWNASTGAGTKSFLFGLNASNQFAFFVSADGSAAVNVVSTVAFTAGNEYVFFLRHDSVNNTISIRINQETPVSLSHSTGVVSIPSTDFTIGGSFGAPGTFGNASTISGELDLLVFDKVLSDQEMSDYYTELLL